MPVSEASPHERAAEEFAHRIGEQKGDVVSTVFLYGSVVRGEERGTDSDVDILVVLRGSVDRSEQEHEIRDIAYDVELEEGIVLSLIVKTEAEFERAKHRPFLQNVRHDAEILHG